MNGIADTITITITVTVAAADKSEDFRINRIQGDVLVSTGEAVAKEASRVGASPIKRCKSIIANDNYALAA